MKPSKGGGHGPLPRRMESQVDKIKNVEASLTQLMKTMDPSTSMKNANHGGIESRINAISKMATQLSRTYERMEKERRQETEREIKNKNTEELQEKENLVRTEAESAINLDEEPNRQSNDASSRTKTKKKNLFCATKIGRNLYRILQPILSHENSAE